MNVDIGIYLIWGGGTSKKPNAYNYNEQMVKIWAVKRYCIELLDNLGEGWGRNQNKYMLSCKLPVLMVVKGKKKVSGYYLSAFLAAEGRAIHAED